MLQSTRTAQLLAIASALVGLGSCSRSDSAEASADARISDLLSQLHGANEGEAPQDLFVLLPGFIQQAKLVSDVANESGPSPEALDRLLVDAVAIASCTGFSGAPESTIEPLTRVDLGPSGMESNGAVITFESLRSLVISADAIHAESMHVGNAARLAPLGRALIQVGLLLDDNCREYIAVVGATKLLLLDRGVKILESSLAALAEGDQQTVREMRVVVNELGEQFRQHHTSD